MTRRAEGTVSRGIPSSISPGGMREENRALKGVVVLAPRVVGGAEETLAKKKVSLIPL